MLKTVVGLIALGVLPAILMMSCAGAQMHPQRSASAVIAGIRPAATTSTAGAADPGSQAGRPQSSDSDGLFQTAWSPIGLDYAPETRCSDNNPDWHPHHRPVACNPQPSETCGDSLGTCPARCQQCYSDDLSFIQRGLKVNAITIYRPNYYILKAAHQLGMKVIVGLLDDSVLGLASPAGQTECTDGGTPLYLCGANYASAVIDGACIDTVGGDPFKKCVSHCSVRSDPKRDCVNGDCSCLSDADCRGQPNQCLSGSYMAPLDNPVSGEFLRDGTVIGIQMGNEFFEGCQIPEVPGKHQPCCSHSQKTGRCNAWVVNREVMSTAAQTMRAALDRRGLNNIKISVALVEEQGPNFCQNGAPPPGVDYIADHPYCDFVANLPPYWTTVSGAECWEQARNKEFVVDQKACGETHTYIGETGFNTGCPLTANHGMLKAEGDFVAAMVKAEPACNGQRNPTPLPDFLFEFGDVCPPQGCIAGCGDPQLCDPTCCCQHKCSAEVRCEQGCPACVGNGYFGLFHTPNYGTSGFPPEPKLDPMPSLMCPASAK